MNGLTDFTDWLSPMLVKELRQGVRSRVFVITLLLLQASLVLLTISGLLAANAQADTGTVSAFFWVMCGVFLILFLPMGGLKAIAGERTANTLDLIFLTRLTPRRIVAGKWLAIVAQVTLLVFTILPYIVLRYFLGGVDLGWELLMACGLLMGAAVLSAIAVGFSPLPALLSRAVLAIGFVVGLMFLISMLAMMAMGRGAMSGMPSATAWKDCVAAVVGAVIVIVFMLEFGAGRIAPPAENHSSSLRLIGLGAIAAGSILDHEFFHAADGRTFIAFYFTLPMVVGALCEPPRMVANIYRPFVRRGFFGKAAGRFLYPGWPSATLYALLILCALGLELYFGISAISHDDAVIVLVAVTGALLFPAAVLWLIGTRARYPLAVYLGIQAISVLLYSFASVIADFAGPDFRPILHAIPTCALLSLNFHGVYDTFLEMSLVVTFTGLSIIVLLWKSRQAWKEIGVLEKKAASMEKSAMRSKPAGADAAPAS